MNKKYKKEKIKKIVFLFSTFFLSFVYSLNTFALSDTLSRESNRLSLGSDNLEYEFHSTVYPSIIKNDKLVTYIYRSADRKWEYYFNVVEENSEYYLGEEILAPVGTIKSLIFFHKDTKFYERIFISTMAQTLTNGNCK